MKNKFLIILLTISFFYQNILSAEVFNIESSEIKILNKGNITKAFNGVKITSNDGVEITGKELIYDKKDLTKIKNLKNNDLILSILTLPFLNFKQRKKLIKIIYKSLNKGGGFIFVDKIRSSNSAFEDIFNQVYFDFKLQKQLNPEQILNKSKLLRSSMNLLSANEINSQLNQIGFKKNDVFFKWFNFIGIIAIK